MHTLHFISHTHWDREWYEPFQIFRIRLAQTIDKALDILARDPDYKYFMLDGQTIVLEDYEEIAPARIPVLRGYIESGRVLVGPWYILPDEFLVSGEAIIRNLMRGIRIANSFGKAMMIGYIPDPFGHISQMPQILKGFGIDVAMFRRGLADEPTELWWEGADGTRVLTTYLRDGYDNAAWLPREPERFAVGLQKLIDSLAPHAVTENILMMNGTDHMMPWDNLTMLMSAAEKIIPDVQIVHSNLPQYAHSVEEALNGKENLTMVKGELRNPKRHHLLPGVTSTRMWIKQRNARAQTLLEQWAEPLAAIAMNLRSTDGKAIRDLRPELQLAWKYLMQNHPHDSICGCSVDQVHDEMVPRFDWVEQIGGDIVQDALLPIVDAIDARREKSAVAIVVFNLTPGPHADAVTVQVDLPGSLEKYQLMDANGATVPVVELGRHLDEIFSVSATADDLRWMFGAAQSGKVDEYILREAAFRVEGDQAYVDITVSNQGEPDQAMVQAGLDQLAELVNGGQIKTFHVRVHSLIKVDLTFFARDLPGYGYKTFWLAAETSSSSVATNSPIPSEAEGGELIIENEYFRIEPNPDDGALTITDKLTGTIYLGANRFEDGGDRGDLYNYTPPEHDSIFNAPYAPPVIELLENNSVRQIMRIQMDLGVPASLAPDRTSRSDEMVDAYISTVITLYAGARRVDFHTQVDNEARDHRLRVLFPTPIHTNQATAGQAFDLVKRELQLPAATPDWVEQPRPEAPMQKFVAVNDGRIGVALASRGLPEYEVRADDSSQGVTIALTLLRCMDWLSRPDLHNRRGDAGPEKQTPGAQEIGTHFFEYALISYYADALPAGEEEKTFLAWGGAHQEALAFNAPLRAVATDSHSGSLPSTGSFVEVSNADFILTAIKPPEDAATLRQPLDPRARSVESRGNGLIVRGFNAGVKEIQTHVKPFREFAHVSRTNLNEAILEGLDWDKAQRVMLQVKPREIVTLRFED